jgi:hypothetical protein
MIKPEMRDNAPVLWTWLRMRYATCLWWQIKGHTMIEYVRPYELTGCE